MEVAKRLRGRARSALVGSNGPRRFLAPGLSLDRFFELLDEHEVPYAVLRWFEDLPHVEPGEDIDILVADECLDYVRTLLVARQAGSDRQKFDLYTASGLPHSDFGGIPYYPPRFARELLATTEVLRGRYRVPDALHHFDSLAYHAVYHKGYASGLATGHGRDRASEPSDHDYHQVLSGRAVELGLEVDLTLDGLDRYLAAKGLRPPLDTLERLLPRNPWIHDRFLADLPAIEPVWRGLAVFVLRERARDGVDLARAELDQNGFEVLDVVELDDAQQERASHLLRGGNWERGPWALSGGRPAAYVVVYDVSPQLDPEDGGRADNLRIPPAKARLRDRLLADLPEEGQYNPVHSSDNPWQALDYLEVLGDPAVVERVRERAERLLSSVAFPFPVVRHLGGHARRAQVAVVDHPEHGLSVCKVFRPAAERFCQREVRARTELADLPEVPALLDSGDTWLVTPLYTDDASHVARRLPVHDEVQLRPRAARAVARLARDLHERGLFLLDLSSANLISDPDAGLKVLDLEFLQDYRGPAPALADGYTVRGVPAGVDGYDLPRDTLLSRRGAGSAFHPAVTGLPVAALLRPERPLDRLAGPALQLAWHAGLTYRAQRVALRSRLRATGWPRRARTLVRALRHLARSRVGRVGRRQPVHS